MDQEPNIPPSKLPGPRPEHLAGILDLANNHRRELLTVWRQREPARWEKVASKEDFYTALAELVEEPDGLARWERVVRGCSKPERFSVVARTLHQARSRWEKCGHDPGEVHVKNGDGKLKLDLRKIARELTLNGEEDQGLVLTLNHIEAFFLVDGKAIAVNQSETQFLSKEPSELFESQAPTLADEPDERKDADPAQPAETWEPEAVADGGWAAAVNRLVTASSLLDPRRPDQLAATQIVEAAVALVQAAEAAVAAERQELDHTAAQLTLSELPDLGDPVFAVARAKWSKAWPAFTTVHLRAAIEILQPQAQTFLRAGEQLETNRRALLDAVSGREEDTPALSAALATAKHDLKRAQAELIAAWTIAADAQAAPASDQKSVLPAETLTDGDATLRSENAIMPVGVDEPPAADDSVDRSSVAGIPDLAEAANAASSTFPPRESPPFLPASSAGREPPPIALDPADDPVDDAGHAPVTGSCEFVWPMNEAGGDELTAPSRSGWNVQGINSHLHTSIIDAAATIAPEAALLALADGQLGLAFHLAQALPSALGAGLAALARLTAAFTLAPGALERDVDRLSDDVRQLLSLVGEATTLIEATETRRAFDLLVLASVLEPATRTLPLALSPVLRAIVADTRLGRPALGRVAERALNLAERGLQLDGSALARLRGGEEASHAAREAAVACARFVETEQRARVLYQPATTVWHVWLRSESPLGEALADTRRATVEARARVAKIIENWSTDDQIDAHIAKTDKALRGDLGRISIEYRARTRLISKAREAVALLRRWCDAHDGVGDTRVRPVVVEAGKVRAAIRRDGKELQAELGGSPGESPLLAGALRCVERAVGALIQRLDGRPTAAVAGPVSLGLDAFLNGPLLVLPEVRLSEGWQLRDGARPSTAALLRLLAGDGDSAAVALTTSFETRLRALDHVGTSLIRDWLASLAPDDPLIKQFDVRRERALIEAKRDLKRRHGELRRRLDDRVAMAFGDGRRQQLDAHLVAIGDIDGRNDLDAVQDGLACIGTAIENLLTERATELRERLNGSTLASAARERIDEALAAGRIHVAEDWLERAERGEVLPDSEGPGLLERFFPSASGHLQQQGSGFLATLATNLALGSVAAPFASPDLDQASRESGRDLLMAWLALNETNAAPPAGALQRVLELLGFNNASVTAAARGGSSNQNQFAFSFSCAPVANGQVCALPTFGSEAAGRYRLLLLRKRQSAAAIDMAINQQGEGPPVIVLFAGLLPAGERMQLRAMCRKQRLACLVLDDALAAFLATQTSDRLTAFFTCALPFAHGVAYGAGAPSVELFHGRRHERERVLAVDSDAAHLVYGGRQLGKTALLRQIERDLAGNPNHLVRYLDLKSERIGKGLPPSELLALLARTLPELARGEPAASRPSRFEDAVRAWLGARPGRRILVLLDEADDFLQADAANRFVELGRLKALMETTGRRFKTVFAGLHNVQRVARDSNTPVAHLGAPVEIGPFLSGDDLRTAHALVERPLAALGYVPSEPSVTTRILSEANYYPSLIQLLCKSLVEVLDGEAAKATSVPVHIDHDKVELALARNQLRHEIGYRFDLTLRLDPRYQVLALLVAQASLVDRSRLTTGLRSAEIRDRALSWWGDGFADDSSFTVFKNFLDELVGLGVLRRPGISESYALRNANLLGLLGSEEDIQQKLEDTRTLEVESGYNPVHEHRELKGGRPWRRSPLNASQENELLRPDGGVGILTGLAIAGLAQVEEGLRLACERAHHRTSLHNVAADVDLKRLAQRVRDSLKQDRSAGHLFLVTPGSPAEPSWCATLREACTPSKSAGAVKGWARVVFMLDPVGWWRWRQAAAGEPATGAVAETHLAPWSAKTLRQLQIDEFELVHSRLGKEQTARLTGYWALPLSELAELSQEPPGLERLSERYNAVHAPAARLADLIAAAEPLPVLQTMALVGEPATAQDLAELGSHSMPLVEAAVAWGSTLGVIRGPAEALQLDPIAAQALA